MIAVAIVGVLLRIALPSYQQHVMRGSRQAAQSELLEMSNLEEKIYLNSNAYSTSISGGYTALATGGLGRTNSLSRDSKYTYSITGTTSSGLTLTYTITATPNSGTSQASDGTLSISSTGTRVWGTTTW